MPPPASASDKRVAVMPSVQVQIESMREEHFDRIVELEPIIFPDEASTRDECRLYFHAKYSFIARVSGDSFQDIAGYIFANPIKNSRLLIGNIGVQPDLQGCGIGSQLLDRVIKEAEETGLTMGLRVRLLNNIAIKLYEKKGFVGGQTIRSG